MKPSSDPGKPSFGFILYSKETIRAVNLHLGTSFYNINFVFLSPSSFHRRLQHHVLLHQPTAEDITLILSLYTSKLNCAADLSLTQASAALCDLSATASEVESFVRNAFMHAIRQKVTALEQKAANGDILPDRLASTEPDSVEYKVTQEHFDLALEDLLGERSTTVDNNNDDTAMAGVASSAVAEKPEQPSFEWSGGFSFGV